MRYMQNIISRSEWPLIQYTVHWQLEVGTFFDSVLTHIIKSIGCRRQYFEICLVLERLLPESASESESNPSPGQILISEL